MNTSPINTPLLHFAQILSNIANKPISKEISSHALLSFGYFWDNAFCDDTHANNAQNKMHNVFILHPILHPIISEAHISQVRYEIGTEFGIAWLLAYGLLTHHNALDSELQAKLETLDVGYLSSESNLAEEELEQIQNFFSQEGRKGFGLVLGSELSTHKNATQIAHILGIICKNLDIDIFMPELNECIKPIENTQPELCVCEDLPESNGHFVYILPHSIASDYTSSHASMLYTPALFAPALKLKSDQNIQLAFENKHIQATCYTHSQLKGTIALLRLQPNTNYQALGYPYKKVEVIL